MRKEEFDFDPDSPGYVGRSKAHCSKHNLRDVHDLIRSVLEYYMAETKPPTGHLLAASRILRAAANRLDNELEDRRVEKMMQLRELRLALIKLREEV